MSSLSSLGSSDGSLSSAAGDFATGSSLIDSTLSPLLDFVGQIGFVLRIADALGVVSSFA